MNDLANLRAAWEASGTLADYQAYLHAKIRAGRARYVFIDPDGTIRWPTLAAIVLAETGVVYGTQCGGVATTERCAEGYLVPLGGFRYDTEREDRVAWDDTTEFAQVFHGSGGGCYHQTSGHELGAEKLAILRDLVADIAFWSTPGPHSTNDARLNISLDMERLDDLVEGWVPVVTPHGRGILIWDNCV